VTITNFIWLFIKPSHVIFIAAILGIVFWHRRFGHWCRNLAALLIVAFGLLPIAAFLIKPLETRFPMPSNLEDVDGIVVLAGSELTKLSEVYGQPQLNSMGDRLTTFLSLATRYPDARLVHSGRNQSEAASALILGAGIESRRITFEDKSRNTCQSATITRELVAPNPNENWLLVTSAFHLPRAVACFRAANWEVIPYPADYRRGTNPFHLGLATNLEDLDRAAHEWLGLVYYRLRGFTDTFFPGPRHLD
jgi:uncharacterized SAM-binding protein YcdF (DUF218 family)